MSTSRDTSRIIIDIDIPEVIDVDAIMDAIDVDAPDPFATWFDWSPSPPVRRLSSGALVGGVKKSPFIHKGLRLQGQTQIAHYKSGSVADRHRSLREIIQATRKVCLSLYHPTILLMAPTSF
jgi:hypothetical protein